MNRFRRFGRSASMLGLIALSASSVLADRPVWQAPLEARQVLNEAKARDLNIDAQAGALIRLAWNDPTASAEVRAAARQELVGFANYALRPMRIAFREIPAVHQADVVAAFNEAAFRVRSSLPNDLLAGLDEFIWYGNAEARRLAMIEVSRFAYPPSVMSIIDAAHDDPALIRTAARSLGMLRDDRAHIFLSKIVYEPDERVARTAASAMAAIGGRAREFLRTAVKSAPAEVQRHAVAALIERATLDDLTVLHEFIGDHLDVEGDELVERTRAKAAELELRLEEAQNPQ